MPISSLIRLTIFSSPAGLLGFLVEPIGPQNCAGLGGDQLDIDPKRGSETSHAPLERVANPQLLADRPHVLELAVVCIGGLTRGDRHIGDECKITGQVICDGVGQVIVRWLATQIIERQHDDR
jgi:hypothetical protein